MDTQINQNGMSRRKFLETVGAGDLAVLLSGGIVEGHQKIYGFEELKKYAEAELNKVSSSEGPELRLFKGIVDDNQVFQLMFTGANRLPPSSFWTVFCPL